MTNRLAPQTVIVSNRCVFCSTEHQIELDRTRYNRWVAGGHIQVVFPTMTPSQREVLISGTCPDCWDKHMGPDDEEEPISFQEMFRRHYPDGVGENPNV
jgi:hypothetical protein